MIDLVVLGKWLDLKFSEVFSSFNDTMFYDFLYFLIFSFSYFSVVLKRSQCYTTLKIHVSIHTS